MTTGACAGMSRVRSSPLNLLFPSHDAASPGSYTLSLHDALPIFGSMVGAAGVVLAIPIAIYGWPLRSEEHTSELQSRGHLVCRLLLEKKKMLSGELMEGREGDGRRHLSNIGLMTRSRERTSSRPR